MPLPTPRHPSVVCRYPLHLDHTYIMKCLSFVITNYTSNIPRHMLLPASPGTTHPVLPQQLLNSSTSPPSYPRTPANSTYCSLVRRKAPFIPSPVLHLAFSSPYLTRNSPNPPRPSTTPIQPIHDADLFRSSHNVAYYLPRNVTLDKLARLLSIYHCKFNNDYNCYAYGSNSNRATREGGEWVRETRKSGVDANGVAADWRSGWGRSWRWLHVILACWRWGRRRLRR